MKYQNTLVLLTFFVFSIKPHAVFAVETLGSLVTRATDIIDLIIPLLFVLMFLAFTRDAIVAIRTAGSDSKNEAKKRLAWGVLALFVALSVWGLVNQLYQTFLG
jgi:hypothetical protein